MLKIITASTVRFLSRHRREFRMMLIKIRVAGRKKFTVGRAKQYSGLNSPTCIVCEQCIVKKKNCY